jgi:hypothetical protein
VKKGILWIACSLRLIANAQDYWQQEANYSIDVRLNIAERSVDGFLKLQYINHSPDTLRYLWFHLTPNAYKNDRTAYSEHLLENGRLDFYFSDPSQRGYINRLDFRIDGQIVQTQDHPQYIDLVKLILPQSLAPGDSIQIGTPFHEKIPDDFSGFGFNSPDYHLIQWYPEIAVYDKQGWHPEPKLDQGEQYHEFGSFDVRITVPANYLVASSGDLQDEVEKKWMLDPHRRDSAIFPPATGSFKTRSHQSGTKAPLHSNLPEGGIGSSKTLHFQQWKCNGFSWFASPDFDVQQDTLLLPSGRIIEAYIFYLPQSATLWKNAMAFLKTSVRFHSALLGEFPYHTVSIVETAPLRSHAPGYPAIPQISIKTGPQALDLAINHALGLFWLAGMVGPDGFQHPWMSEGLNAYYDRLYQEQEYPRSGAAQLASKWPKDPNILVIDQLAKEKLDQPIATSSEEFNRINYHFIAYAKTGIWMTHLQDSLGKIPFDSSLKEYFQAWKFRHPGPADFRAEMRIPDSKKMADPFLKLAQTGPVTPPNPHRILRPVFLFSQRNTDQVNVIGIGPALGYNLYDQLMVGLVIHNYHLPSENFQFFLAPLYGIGSKQLNGIGRISYSWYPGGMIRKLELGLNGSRFSTLSGTDSNGNKIVGGFYKWVPFLRLTGKTRTPRSSFEDWVEFKTFGIGEKGFNYVMKSTDSSNSFPAPQKYSFRYLNQLTFHAEDYRVLYPYDIQLQFQQGSEFYRVNLCSHYFFNYAQGGGVSMRFFTAKFGYIGPKTTEKEFDTSPYQPKLTASRGYLNEDYTYSNYFLGRSEFTGFPSQQIMMKDGGLKIRTDLFEDLQGRSDDWIAALNLNSTLPAQLMPAFIPLRVFADLGTYAGAWGNNPPTSKFLYVCGLQLSFFKGLLNIYAPLVYSIDFSNNLKTVPAENTFLKKISFSIDIQDFDLKKMLGNLPLGHDR